MPSKTEFYRQMADHVATQLTGSWQEWAGFLTTAARLYKYPFHEQLLIYAQRPDATACAEYDLWNEKMGRYVRRGSKGIALVDDSGDRPRLRYVFDVSDTGPREHSRTPWLWKMEEAYQEPVSAMLEHTYEVGGDNLAQQLEAVAHKLAGEYWNEHRQDLLYIVDDSFLEEYDEFNIEAQFKAAATVSISYALMSRCGLEPERYFTHEDFMAIFDFNTPATIGALGTAVSQINQQVLRQIGVTIRNYEREQLAERSKHHEESHELHPERRLSDSRPEAERTAGEAPGQVRQDAESIPQGTPSHPIQPAADEREAVPTPAGNRRDRTEPSGAADAPAGERRGRDGAAESQRPHAVGGPDEQHPGSGGGSGADGAGLRGRISGPLIAGEELPQAPVDRTSGTTGLQNSHHDFNARTDIPYYHEDSEKTELLRVSDALKDHRIEIAAFFEAHEDRKERGDFIKGFFNNTYVEKILSNGQRAGYRAWDDVLNLWRGAYLSREKEDFLRWPHVADAIQGMILLGQWLAAPLSAIFVSYDAALLELTVSAYKLYALCFLFMGFAMYASAFFTALNNGLVSAVISFLRTLVFQVAAVIVLPMLFGIDGIWLSVTVGDGLTCLVAATFMIALSGRYGYRKRGLSPKAKAKAENGD